MNAPINWKACRPSKSAADNILTPKARMSFVTLAEARKAPGSDKAKFSVSLLIPADCDLALLKQAAKQAAIDMFGAKLPPKLKDPFLKAEECINAKTGEPYSGYEPGWIVIRATAISRPGIVYPNGQAVPEGEVAKEAYSGRWACASLRAFAYDNSGNKGVSFGLQNIQLLDHDKPLGGRVNAESEFEAADGFEDSGGAAGDSKSTPWD